jgi:outer membrane lipoprotein LolB
LTFCLLALAGCSATRPLSPVEADRARLYESRYQSLNQVEEWALEGRLAVNDGEEGGSGHLNWLSRAGFSRMDFYGALGRGAWQLSADADGVLLEMASGETYRADDINELVRRQLGWDIPVDALEWWVRGLVSPGDWEARELDEEGRLVMLEQHGWTIEFASYRQIGGISMPRKMNAKQQTHQVKLAIRNWRVDNRDDDGG